VRYRQWRIGVKIVKRKKKPGLFWPKKIRGKTSDEIQGLVNVKKSGGLPRKKNHSKGMTCEGGQDPKVLFRFWPCRQNKSIRFNI